jgi:succinate dehydrogenase/fumarate reductase flavoprotein subunit
METDVVVVGYGAAGATSAINAADNGAEVILLEKMPAGGGNSRLSGGNIMIPREQNFAKYLNRLTFGTTPPELIDMYVTMAMENGNYIRSLGGDVLIFTPLGVTFPKIAPRASFPDLPYSDLMDKYNVVGDPEVKPAQRLWDLLSANVDKRKNIKVMLKTPAKELCQNEAGEIVGLIAESEGKRIAIKAKKAVIMTLGGFEFNDDMKKDYLPVKSSAALGCPGNTGDGIKMVQKVGADLWHMTALACSMGIKVPEFESAFPNFFLGPAFIFVNQRAKRFVDETTIEGHAYWMHFSHLDEKLIEFPNNPWYAIFSEENRKRGAFFTGGVGNNRDLYKWSLDNMEEIKKGWIIKADTIAELAKKINVDAAQLEKSLQKYNDDCKSGLDTDYGRTKERLRSVDGPPYYAMTIQPSLINTQGGPRRDKESRVLDPFGKPIPRLYNVGEFGSIWGFVYQGANNLGECLVFGRIAGKNAANEKPWS